jgi:hypothetical protein
MIEFWCKCFSKVRLLEMAVLLCSSAYWSMPNAESIDIHDWLANLNQLESSLGWPGRAIMGPVIIILLSPGKKINLMSWPNDFHLSQWQQKMESYEILWRIPWKVLLGLHTGQTKFKKFDGQKCGPKSPMSEETFPIQIIRSLKLLAAWSPSLQISI